MQFLKVTAKKAGHPTLVRLDRIDVITPFQWEEEEKQHGVPVTVLVKGAMIFVRDSKEGLAVREHPEELTALIEKVGHKI